MASALLRGLCRSGIEPRLLSAYDVDAEKTHALEKELGILSITSPETLAREADVIVLAVKPQVALSALRQLGDALASRLLISIAAGITTRALADHASPETRIVRTMPNTPALVLRGVSAFAAGPNATPDDLSFTEHFLSTCGAAVRVEESMMDAVTGLSGSGPAYVMMIIEALSDGGVRAGLPRPTATMLAAQTLLGSAELLLQSGKHPGQLKDAVTSPGGTTIAGLHALEKAGLRAALMDAVLAATARSKELAGV